jgi:SWI/SNF-related matrix-associated actin-dependent regulator 1 of chromatin subfamily A
VIKLVSRNTIEEDMLKLGETKLALDEAVAGDIDDPKAGQAVERQMKQSLMNVLRNQVQEGEDEDENTSS